MELQRILGTDTGKAAFYKADDNFQAIQEDVNESTESIVDIREQISTIQTQTILENYLSSHDISSLAKRGKLDVALKGMSSVNLFGTDGNCEDISKFKTGYGTPTLSLDAANKVYGSNALKLVTTVVGHGTGLSFKAQAGKYYMLSIYCKVTTGTLQHTVYDMSNDKQISGGISVSSANMVRTVRKLAVTADSADVRWLWKQQDATAMTAYIDGVMVNEISDDEYNNLTADELMAKYPYFEGLQGVSNIQVLSSGKNIANLDINRAYRREGQTYPNISLKDSTFTISGATAAGRFIAFNYRVAKGRQYTVSFNKNNADIGFKAYSTKPSYWNGYGISLANGTIITASEEWLQIYFEVAEGQIGTVSNFQLEEGTAATAYEPYKSTENLYKTLDGQVVTIHRTSDSVYDEILKDGRCIKRNGEYLLKGADITQVANISTNYDLINVLRTNIPSIYNQSSGITPSKMFIQNFVRNTTASTSIPDDASNHWQFLDTSSYSAGIKLIVPKGTYANLAAAQSALAGTKIIYELAQPQILETNAMPLIAEPNGHVFITADSCMPSNELSYPLNLGGVVDGLLNGQKEQSLNSENQFKYLAETSGYIVTKKVDSQDCNTLIKNGKYAIYQGINVPNSAVSYILDVTQRDNGSVIQELVELNHLVINKYIRAGRLLSGIMTWGTWEKIITDKQPAWINATLQSGWTGYLMYRRNQIGQLEIKGDITAGTITAGTIVATFQEGFKPVTNAPLSAHDGNFTTSRTDCFVLATDGRLLTYAPGASTLQSTSILRINAVLL